MNHAEYIPRLGELISRWKGDGVFTGRESHNTQETTIAQYWQSPSSPNTDEVTHFQIASEIYHLVNLGRSYVEVPSEKQSGSIYGLGIYKLKNNSGKLLLRERVSTLRDKL